MAEPDRDMQRIEERFAGDLAAALESLDRETKRLADLTGQMETVLRVVDTSRLLAALDDRLAGLLDETRQLRETRNRVNILLTRDDDRRSTEAVGLDRSTLLGWLGAFFVVQLLVLVLIQQVL